MSNKFSEGQVVNTKFGVGKITYYDDDYMDVVVNGAEKNFFAPFDGKVWEYQQPSAGDQMWLDILARADMATLIRLTKLNLHAISFVVSLYKGNTTEWDDLTATQKMNHIAVTSKLPLAVWAEAYRTGEIADLIAEYSGRKSKNITDG